MPRSVAADFVDRRYELAHFRQMLDSEVDERILLILERSEQGKSYFLLRLDHECNQCSPSIPVILLDFDERKSGLTDYLSIARKVRRDLGDERTPAICDCLDQIYRHSPVVHVQTGSGEGGGVDFGRRGRFKEAQISETAGRDNIRVNIRDVSVEPTRPDQEEHWKAEMGRALLSDLISIAETHPRIVLLVDTFEQAPDEACAWLERWLLDSLRRELPHVILVVAGRPTCRSFFERPHRWSCLLKVVNHFSPLSDEDILDHYSQRGLGVPESESSLIEIARASPARMAQLGDWLEQSQGGA